jgi:acyl carrier protein
MTRDEIMDGLKMLISNHMGVDIADVTPSASFYDDLRCDSLDMVELVMLAEDKFRLDIPDADAEGLLTVDDAATYVARRLDAGERRASA